MHRPPARRPRRLAGTLSLVAVVASACADDGPAGTSQPHVVAIAAQPCDRPMPAEGVGVVVAPGLVVTAGHVVEGRRRAVTVDGAAATVVLVDARTDLALVAADVTGRATVGDDPTGSTHLVTPVGDVAAPIVRTGTLIVHDITAHARHERQAHTLDVAVDKGASGTPLVDARGALVGVVVLANRTDVTTFAVTGNEVARLIRRRPRLEEVTTETPCPE